MKEREDAIEQNRVQISQWESKSKSLQATVEKRGQETEVQRLLIADLTDQLASLQADLEQQAAKSDSLKTQLSTKSDQYDQSLKEITGLTQTLGEQRTSLTKLAADLKDAEELRPQNALLMSRIDELMLHLKRVNAEHEDSLEANSVALDRIRDLDADLHAQAAKIRELRRERGSIRDLDSGEGEFRRAA